MTHQDNLVNAHAWLAATILQTLSGLYGQSLDVVVAEPTPRSLGTAASIDLTFEQAGCRLTALVACAPEHAVRLASSLLRRDVTLHDGGLDIVGETANMIGGRLKALLIERGVVLRLGLPRIEIKPVVIDIDEWHACTWIRTPGDERFFVSVRAHGDDAFSIVRECFETPPALTPALTPALVDDDADAFLF